MAELEEEHGFLEELLGLRRETYYWENFPPADMGEFFSTNGGSSFEEYSHYNQGNPSSLVLPYSSLEGFASSSETANFDSSLNNEVMCCPFGFSVNEFDLYSSENYNDHAVPCLIQEDCPASNIIDQGENNLSDLLLGDVSLHDLEKKCKVELAQETKPPAFDIGRNCLGSRKNNKAKKLNGQPSKNLMAERRRRKRLNDRLSMLRSVVPKISKMDRTSILGDTIDYLKELLDRIKRMKEDIQVGADQTDLLNIFKELKSNEILVRNTPKFDVERRSKDTRLEICCAAKPGLLLSTVTTLETLGLEIQQCVISCFNDFGMQAFCSEEMEQRAILSSEDIKQALFRSAGYGGRCM